MNQAANSQVRSMIGAAQAGDLDAQARILEIMDPVVKSLGSRYYYPGADRDDVLQEARIGLLSGIRSWRDGSTGDVCGFLGFCAERNVITALKTARRLKYRSLNEAVSMDYCLASDDSDASTMHELVGGGVDPAEQLTAQDRLDRVIRVIRAELTPLERESLISIVNGEQYAHKQGSKVVDNAVQRARRKIRFAMAA